MTRWIFPLTLCLAFALPDCARAEPVLSVGSAAVVSGQTFDIAIGIAGVDADVGLTAWQLDLEFDPAILSALSVSEGPFLSAGGFTLFTPGAIDNESGAITLIADAYVDLPPLPSGSGVLATVTFTALANGTSALRVGNPFLDFADSGFRSQGGRVVVGLPAVPEPGNWSLAIAGVCVLMMVFRRRRHTGAHRDALSPASRAGEAHLHRRTFTRSAQ